MSSTVTNQTRFCNIRYDTEHIVNLQNVSITKRFVAYYNQILSGFSSNNAFALRLLAIPEVAVVLCKSNRVLPGTIRRLASVAALLSVPIADCDVGTTHVYQYTGSKSIQTSISYGENSFYLSSFPDVACAQVWSGYLSAASAKALNQRRILVVLSLLICLHSTRLDCLLRLLLFLRLRVEQSS